MYREIVLQTVEDVATLLTKLKCRNIIIILKVNCKLMSNPDIETGTLGFSLLIDNAIYYSFVEELS